MAQISRWTNDRKQSMASIRNRHSYSVGALLSLSFLLALLVAWTSVAQQTDRAKQPALDPPPVLKLPVVQHLKLSNGLKVVLMEKHDVPLVQMELIVMAGSVNDPLEQGGLASMTSALMDEGVVGRTSLQLADAIDYLGASISPSMGFHTSGVSVHTPLSKLDSALALAADIALRPTFPAEELERQRKQRLTTLIQWHDDARSIVSALYDKLLFGEAHPYGRPAIGSEKAIRSFQPSDLEKFHSTYYSPSNATIVVVGDVTASSILPKLEKQFGKWKARSVVPPKWPTAHQVEERKIYLVDKPGAAQSEIRIGRLGVSRLTEDFYALEVLNTILGGSFTSRLNQNLREQHGYSYGASSSFAFRPLQGPFTARAAVQTDVTDKALTEFMKELENIMLPVSDEELTRAKNYLALGYPGNFESVAQVAGQLIDLTIYNLPDSYFNSYIQKVFAVSKDDVLRAAKKYLDPEKVNIVIVGDRAKVEAGVKALEVAPVQFFTIEDVLGPVPVIDRND